MGPQPPHAAMMRSAIDAAHHGHRGTNPLVGAVLCDQQGQVLSTGYHQGAGTAHAERDAIERARAAGITDFSTATLYSTLEPCNHQGRQPACTQLIGETGIGSLIYGAADPTPHGGGGEELAQAGVHVVAGIEAEKCRQLNHRWALAAVQDRPFVTVHLAQSMDAHIAAADGTSQWITSAASRQHTHRIRQRVDAILVGTTTALTDNPRLTARTDTGEPAASQPLRCVMGHREIPHTAALTQNQPEGNGWLQLRTRDPLAALQELAKTEHSGHAVKHLLVEGGQNVISAFFAADLVDEVFLYQAPLLLGAGRRGLGDLGITTLAQARRFQLDHSDGGPVTIFDNDVCTHLTPVERAH